VNTLADLLRRERACEWSEPLWAGLDSLPLDELRSRWTPLGACLLAVADGRGPRCGAVAWISARLDHVLRGAILRGAILRRAILTGADLRGTDLRCADLTDATLPEATLTGAILTRADLTRAVLTDAILSSAILDGAILEGATLTGVILDGAYRPEGGIPGWEPDADGYLRRAA
jgi:hypothetical protein